MTIIEYESADTEEQKDNVVAGKAVITGVRSLRICVDCDVTWIGFADSLCWSCDSPPHVPQPGERWVRKHGGVHDNPLTVLESNSPSRVRYQVFEGGADKQVDTDRRTFIDNHFYIGPAL